MKERNTQIGDIKDYMMNHDGITSIDAIKKFGCTRLADVIYRLKREPYNLHIKTFTKNVKNRYGGISSVAFYKLED